MGRSVFNQIMLIIAVILLILMFFFPDVKAVKEIIIRRIDVVTLLLVIGLYIRDMFRSQ